MNKKWIAKLTAATAAAAWILANGLDMLSMVLFLQMGGQLAVANLNMGRHPVEFALIYVGLRTLGTLAACLIAVLAEKHSASIAHIFWNALTAGAIVTAITAWLRIY